MSHVHAPHDRRTDIRNIAIIAHVDHGKTTLVDAVLRQTHVHRKIDDMGERIMDSMDQERERGITIRAKNASVTYKGVKINIVDTPGHADFGGEVERTLRMVDGVLILVDAKEGPMPQTTFVLRKALALGHKAIVVVNKIDRPDAVIDDVVNRTFDLFVHLGATDEQLDFPIVYTSAIKGQATLDVNKPGTDITPLLDTVLENIPAPVINADAPLQILVLALIQDPYKGKMGIGKIQSGSIARRQNVIVIGKDGVQTPGKVSDLAVYSGLERADTEQAAAGEIVAVAGLDDVSIGDTIADAERPIALPRVAIDEPTVQMTFSVNNSPFAGREGKYLTSRHLRDRLFKELETNVSLRVHETDSADRFLVAGRGELHLAVLIEQMRREGYELQVSQPEVILHREGDRVTEPYEELTIQVPDMYQGAVIEEVGKRRGEMRHMKLVHSDAGPSDMHLEYHIPTRGIMGLKNVLLAKTRGTVIMHHVFKAYEPANEQDLVVAPHGSLCAFEDGTSTAYALFMTQERGTLFIGPGVEVYRGMVVGENNRDEDLDVNVCKEKHLSNMRASGSDEALILTPPKEMSLEFALEYIGPDELVEITPQNLRIRKRLLNPEDRRKARKAAK
ncbi:translational GTPase TypA [Nitrospira moscoviensis]|uniref:Large ribosomal subunit assembly factor BipA n=1 Tax=Nitrospira moscoviensis TaxID=42253 RepID=A0A0K2GJ89_NITMO|nr:translational GTPase TypA [Nitrospira moscoviensis]ALA60702.1 GTP-binding protein [Nitrospira moscoviensis]